MHVPRLAIPKKSFVKTATLPPCSCPWQLVNHWAIPYQKPLIKPDALDDPSPPIYPKPFHHITSVESSGSSGITEASYHPPVPHTFSKPHNISAREFRGGFLIAPDQNNSLRLPQATATGTRAAICGVLCARVTLCPCPGQCAHQWALIAREGRKLGITWMTALVAKADSCRSSNPEVGCLLCPKRKWSPITPGG